MTTDYIARAWEKDAERPKAVAPSNVQAVVFTGSAAEFFGIWVVNLLLTVVTFGIYSAWAKVRTQRYFARNLFIGGRSFDYHATGMQILLGRAIVVAVIAAIAIGAQANPLILFAVYPLGVLLFPLLVARSLRFTARNTSWSNVRFDFTGGYGGAFMTYIVIPIGVALTLNLAGPFLTRARQRFFVANHKLGDHRFSFHAGIGGYYLAVLLCAMVIVILLAVVGVLLGPSIMTWVMTLSTGSSPTDEPPLSLLILVYVLTFCVFFPTVIIYRAMCRNLMYRNTKLEGGHTFASHVSPPRLIWIVVSNALAVTFTLGLALPWAKVRLVGYLADSTIVIAAGPFDEIAGRIEADHAAIGEAYTDLEGIEIGGIGI